MEIDKLRKELSIAKEAIKVLAGIVVLLSEDSLKTTRLDDYTAKRISDGDWAWLVEIGEKKNIRNGGRKIIVHSDR